MKILEFEAKKLLEIHGFNIPRGFVINSANEIGHIYNDLNFPVVLKAQILSGGRLKAGGIQFAENKDSVDNATNKLFGKIINQNNVQIILVEEQLEIQTEVFVAVTYNSNQRCIIIVASRSGGVEVEKSKEVIKSNLSSLLPPSDYLGREIARSLNFSGQLLLSLSKYINQLVKCFLLWDALLLEINPLILDKSGKWWVADVHLELDDDAFFRQSELLSNFPKSKELMDRHSEFERRAIEINDADHRGVAGRLIAFDGDLGLLIGGGGASLTAFDSFLSKGLKPANYCEIGGNPSVWKIKELTKLILSQPQVKKLAVVMNVVSNTRVDLVARGVIKGALELGKEPKDVITAFRIPGSWEDEGKSILDAYEIPFFGREFSIDQVIEKIKWLS